MENENSFDLNRALLAWKEELSRHPGVSAEDLRELESHLLECFSGGRGRGLNAREAFDEAVRRIGSSEQVGGEFEKIHPLRGWRQRVFLMALAGLTIWAWGGGVQTFLFGAQVVWGWSLAHLVAAGVLLNGIVPITALILVAKGSGGGFLRVVGGLFGSRWALAFVTISYALLLNYVSAWSMWNHPSHESILGKGGRETLSVATLFWQHTSHLPAWPGPLLVLLLWLAPTARGTLKAEYRVRSFGAQMIFWMALGGVMLACISSVNLAVSPLLYKLAYSMFPAAERPYLIVTSAFNWTSGLVVWGLAVLAVRGSLGRIEVLATRQMVSRTRIAVVGGAAILLPYALISLTSSQPFTDRLVMLAYMAVWPVILLGFVAWLAPSVRRTT